MCIRDSCLTDQKKVAYVPVYTCETVLSPFLKAGYQLKFYGVSRDMTPVFDEAALELSLIHILHLLGRHGGPSGAHLFLSRKRSYHVHCQPVRLVL